MTKSAHKRTPRSLSLVLATTAALAALPGGPAISAPLLPSDLAQQHANDASEIVNVAVVVRPGVRWARPSYYRWGPGGAIAAGAAIGFLAAGAAVAYGTPPAPGMCWFYTDPGRTQGFWDYCPVQ